MIWNITIKKPFENFLTGMYFEADSIKEAIEKAEKYGKVVKAVWSEYKEE